METIKYYEFRSVFKTTLRGDNNPAKQKLGQILRTLSGSAHGRTEILEKAKKLSGIHIYISESSQKNLSNGRGNEDTAWAFYYWLHVTMPECSDLSDVDRMLLEDGGTFAEKIGRPVFVAGIDSDLEAFSMQEDEQGHWPLIENRLIATFKAITSEYKIDRLKLGNMVFKSLLTYCLRL